MRAMNLVGVCGLFLVMACADDREVDQTTNELGLEVTRLDDAHIEGRLTTSLGAVSFTAEAISDKLFEVQLDRGRGAFGSVVDWNQYTAEFAAPPDFAMTEDDRFIITALATAIEEEIGKQSPVTDNLFRQASLWGAHPVGAMILKTVVADAERGWTSLCSAGACSCTPSRTFYHSGAGCDNGHVCGSNCSHAGTTLGNSLYFGYCEGHNPCHARCGAGCYSVGTSAYTQDCGNHDACEHRHTSDCGSELSSASDDFTFAGNCSC
jgi:hypothetical protein